MQVKRNKIDYLNGVKATAIITADWHAMELGNNPPCRLDDYMSAFTSKVKEIGKLEELNDCPILNAGDIFDHWKPSPELINYCCSIFPLHMKTVAGNHDLPQHNLDLFEKSGYASLNYAKVIDHLEEQLSWNQDSSTWKAEYNIYAGKSVVMLHKMVWKDEMPFPNCKDPNIDQIFEMFPKADLIITGDNHKTFTARKGRQLLINPGSLMRRRASQINHRPCVFLWYADSHQYKIHYLKIDKDVISRKHIDQENERQENQELFLGKLDQEWSPDFSFEDNMDRAIKRNNLPKSIIKYILEWMGK